MSGYFEAPDGVIEFADAGRVRKRARSVVEIGGVSARVEYEVTCLHTFAWGPWRIRVYAKDMHEAELLVTKCGYRKWERWDRAEREDAFLRGLR